MARRKLRHRAEAWNGTERAELRIIPTHLVPDGPRQARLPPAAALPPRLLLAHPPARQGPTRMLNSSVACDTEMLILIDCT